MPIIGSVSVERSEETNHTGYEWEPAAAIPLREIRTVKRSVLTSAVALCGGATTFGRGAFHKNIVAFLSSPKPELSQSDNLSTVK
jgi:hypothetical protein